MVKGLYVAGTSMVANTDKIDVISNNLANVNTAGYKKDRMGVESFNDRLFSRIKGSDYMANTKPIKVTLSMVDKEYNLKTTNGYFKVDTEDGIHYTDEVRFIKDKDGYLRTIRKNVGGTFDWLSGDKILSDKGPVYVGDSDFDIDELGNVSVGGQTVGNLVQKNKLNNIGLMSAGVKSAKILTDYESGQLEHTGQKYDVALKGEGFFHVEVAGKDYLSRNGAFTINSNNELVTMDGYKVLGVEGPIIINDENFSINEYGEIIQDGQITDKFALTNYTNVGDLQKVGGSFIKVLPNPTGEKVEFDGKVLQGFLEGSNADAVTEMINLIQMNRNYESSSKAITTIDDMISKAVNDLGRV